MAIVHVKINTSKTLGNELYRLVVAFRTNHSKLKELKDIMNSMTDGTDFTAIEAQFGIPVGEGQAVFDLIVGNLAELNAATDFKKMNDRIVPLI